MKNKVVIFRSPEEMLELNNDGFSIELNFLILEFQVGILTQNSKVNLKV